MKPDPYPIFFIKTFLKNSFHELFVERFVGKLFCIVFVFVSFLVINRFLGDNRDVVIFKLMAFFVGVISSMFLEIYIIPNLKEYCNDMKQQHIKHVEYCANYENNIIKEAEEILKRRAQTPKD